MVFWGTLVWVAIFGLVCLDSAEHRLCYDHVHPRDQCLTSIRGLPSASVAGSGGLASLLPSTGLESSNYQSRIQPSNGNLTLDVTESGAKHSLFRSCASRISSGAVGRLNSRLSCQFPWTELGTCPNQGKPIGASRKS